MFFFVFSNGKFFSHRRTTHTASARRARARDVVNEFHSEGKQKTKIKKKKNSDPKQCVASHVAGPIKPVPE